MPRAQFLRGFLGGLFGLALLAITIAEVDLGSVASVIAAATLPILAMAVIVVFADLSIRAVRWQILLRGVEVGAGGPFRLVAAYLTIGYLANLLLPARLGDVARAFLSGKVFHMSRLSSLGTIMVERVADGGTMLVLAVTSSLVVAGVSSVRTLAIGIVVLVTAGLAMLVIVGVLLTTTRLGATTIGRFTRDVSSRLVAGSQAIHTPLGAASVAVGTAAAASTAILVAWLVAGSVGVPLTPLQATLFVSAIALSLAIPGAPGSLGTYEFAGVLVLTSLAYPADRAFATVVLMRVVSTLPPVALGIVSLWALHLRPATILRPGADLGPNAESGLP